MRPKKRELHELPKKRELHELPYTEMAKSGTIGLTSLVNSWFQYPQPPCYSAAVRGRL